jgi:hypothetical protein
VALSPTTALAGATFPRPQVDSRPRSVAYRHGATIKGHVNGASTADEVHLQKRTPDGWSTRRTDGVGSEGRVSFTFSELETTGKYRLVWRDASSSAHTVSDIFRIRVRPKLTLRPKPRNVLVGRDLVLRGHLYPAVRGRTVRLQRKVNGEWYLMKKVRAGDGSFRATISGRGVGRHRIRAVFGGDARNTRRVNRSRYNVYDPDQATWYGPGFYGNETACGRTLTEDTLGVANRTVPCGTKVSILYHGRTVTVPVIDRGPYSHAEWDLTSATARRLGFEGSNTIGVRH